jgi:predicted  nucleic acid-binding Zn-ribbon protein
MSLKEKAKTYDEIKDWVYLFKLMHENEQKWLEEHKKRLEVKWVRLEDAEQEIAKLQNRLNVLQMVNDGLREQLEEQDWYHRITTVEERIEIAKKAIIAVRHDIARRQTESKGQVPPEYLFGCIGILEFVETGDVDKVLVPDVKKYIEKLLKEVEE